MSEGSKNPSPCANPGLESHQIGLLIRLLIKLQSYESIAINSQCDVVVGRAPAALYWCGNVVIDRRGGEKGSDVM